MSQTSFLWVRALLSKAAARIQGSEIFKIAVSTKKGRQAFRERNGQVLGYLTGGLAWSNIEHHYQLALDDTVAMSPWALCCVLLRLRIGG